MIEAVLLEQPLHPPGRHVVGRAPETDPRPGLQAVGVDGHWLVRCGDRQAGCTGDLFQDAGSVGRWRHDPGARRERPARHVETGGRPEHGDLRRLQFRERREPCVRFRRDDVGPLRRRREDAAAQLDLRHFL